MNDQRQKEFFTTAALAEHIGAELVGGGSVEIYSVNSIEQAGATDVTFITSAKHAKKLAESNAGAVISAERIEQWEGVQLIVKNVEGALIKALGLFAPKLRTVSGVHSSAVIEESAQLEEDVAVGAGVYIGHEVRVGRGSIISCGCVIEENTSIGQNCKLGSNVVVCHDCRIGNNCIIQSNSTIGSTGFGYYFINSEHKLVPHIGSVIIEDCVEIGANSCIDRGKFGDTIIGAGTKIDNLVQIAHNVEIGKCCILASLTGLAGSCRLGDGVILAGQTGVADHVRIGDGAMIGARGGVMSDLPAGSRCFGFPSKDAKEQLRIWAVTRHLPDMAKQLKKVIKKVNNLEASKDDKK